MTRLSRAPTAGVMREYDPHAKTEAGGGEADVRRETGDRHLKMYITSKCEAENVTLTGPPALRPPGPAQGASLHNPALR